MEKGGNGVWLGRSQCCAGRLEPHSSSLDTTHLLYWGYHRGMPPAGSPPGRLSLPRSHLLHRVTYEQGASAAAAAAAANPAYTSSDLRFCLVICQLPWMACIWNFHYFSDCLDGGPPWPCVAYSSGSSNNRLVYDPFGADFTRPLRVASKK
jgi:hypothetical protein